MTAERARKTGPQRSERHFEQVVVRFAGDSGDALAIGGNHIIHLFRRNPDVNVVMFNNRVYGLTKGQFSPTSELGKRTRSSPHGSLDRPVNPASLALGSGCTFVARSAAVFTAHLRETLLKGKEHAGTSFVEVYQNCNIFNDGAFDGTVARGHRDQRVLYLKHGEPLAWGKRWGLAAKGLDLEVIELESEPDRCLVHDEGSLALAQALSRMDPAEGFPVPMGVFFRERLDTYDELVAGTARGREGSLQDLLSAGTTWTVR